MRTSRGLSRNAKYGLNSCFLEQRRSGMGGAAASSMRVHKIVDNWLEGCEGVTRRRNVSAIGRGVYETGVLGKVAWSTR